MSYIQIEIGGKLRGLKFNQYASIKFYKHVDLKDYDASSIYAMVYAGLAANSYVKREEFVDKDGDKETPITFEMVCDWVDKLTDEVVIAVAGAFTESESFKKIIKESEKIADQELTKKNLTISSEKI